MSGFTSGWLQLREPFDHLARADFAAQLSEYAAARETVCVVDLATGRGSNLRYLAPRLGQRQTWICVDHDPNLLAALRSSLLGGTAIRGSRQGTAAFDASVELREDDLSACLSELPIRPGALVSASALLDLVSADWLSLLASRCRELGAFVLFALTYDGRCRCDPPDGLDERVLALVNAHQLTDKGFGPALGPAAAAATADAFTAADYRVVTRRSDWHLPRGAAQMQLALVEGWHRAACELSPEESVSFDAWHLRRRALIGQRQSSITVGHIDLWASPHRMAQ